MRISRGGEFLRMKASKGRQEKPPKKWTSYALHFALFTQAGETADRAEDSLEII